MHMVQLMPLLQKIQNGLSLWYQPTQAVLEKWPINDCVCVTNGTGCYRPDILGRPVPEG